MTHAEEKRLHDTSYCAWLAYVAPHWIEVGTRHPERKAEMWSYASPELKQIIRELTRKAT